jgi:hypothetical protein
MRINETLKFAVKVILPIVIAAVAVFLVLIYVVFPAVSLTFEEFTIVYWSLSIVAFPLNYQARRWTEYVTKRYGSEREKNPVMRKMLIKGDSKTYSIAWLCVYLFLFFYYVIAVYTLNLIFLIDPLLVTVIILCDFLNDFHVIRGLRTDSTKLQMLAH